MTDLEQDIFDSALDNEEAPEAAAPETQEAPEPEVAQGQPRDEAGRFAAKASEPEPTAEPAPETQPQPEAKETGGIPSWRLKEEAEARRAAEERYQNTVREMANLQAQIQQFQRQSQPPPKQPDDIFTDPTAFVNHYASAQVDPVKQEIGQLREFYSQRDAIRDHGPEKVKAAYDWIAQGMQSRDPARMTIYNRAMVSYDPYGEIIREHQKQTLFEQIGSDPIAYTKKQALELAKNDPEFQKELINSVRGSAQTRPGTTQIPPSLTRVSSAPPPNGGDDDDSSDAGMFRYATR